MKYLSRINCLIFFALTISCRAQFEQILISEVSVGKELSIAIHPDSTNRIIAATNEGKFVSDDGGKTWIKSSGLCKRLEFYNRPAVGWFWSKNAFSYIWKQDTCFFDSDACYKLPGNQQRMMRAISLAQGPEKNHLVAAWCETAANHKLPTKDSSLVFYSNSVNGGQSWTSPQRINTVAGEGYGKDSSLNGVNICVGPNKEIYTVWAGPNGIQFRHLNAENSENEKTVAPLINSWKQTIGKNKIPSNGLPSVACDLSNGEFRGRLYICWSDEKHGVNNKNVFLIYSDDQGKNWTEPIVVTYRPNHKEQFMPRLTLDQKNGNLYILYYDQQNYAFGEYTDVYLAQSKNGGLKFDYYKVNTTSFKPKRHSYFGEYFEISAVDNVVRPIWMQSTKKNKSEVYTALIDEKAFLRYQKNYDTGIKHEKTFTYSDHITINFTLKEEGFVTALITKPLEAGFEKIVLQNKKMKKGNNSLLIDSKALGLKKGNYTLTLYYKGYNTFCWILEE